MSDKEKVSPLGSVEFLPFSLRVCRLDTCGIRRGGGESGLAPPKPNQ